MCSKWYLSKLLVEHLLPAKYSPVFPHWQSTAWLIPLFSSRGLTETQSTATHVIKGESWVLATPLMHSDISPHISSCFCVCCNALHVHAYGQYILNVPQLAVCLTMCWRFAPTGEFSGFCSFGGILTSSGAFAATITLFWSPYVRCVSNTGSSVQ